MSPTSSTERCGKQFICVYLRSSAVLSPLHSSVSACLRVSVVQSLLPRSRGRRTGGSASRVFGMPLAHRNRPHLSFDTCGGDGSLKRSLLFARGSFHGADN